MSGKAIIISAPSGAGKTTIVKHLLHIIPSLQFSISVTSRAVREGEINGKDYYFISLKDFEKKIERKEFIEWEEVYQGTKYGTLKTEIQRIWDAGKNVIFDVDVVGGLNLKEYFGEKALSIFIKPPSVEVLKQRLVARGSEDDDMLEQRIDKAAIEISKGHMCELQILNDDLETAKTETETAVKQFLNI